MMTMMIFSIQCSVKSDLREGITAHLQVATYVLRLPRSVHTEFLSQLWYLAATHHATSKFDLHVKA